MPAAVCPEQRRRRRRALALPGLTQPAAATCCEGCIFMRVSAGGAAAPGRRPQSRAQPCRPPRARPPAAADPPRAHARLLRGVVGARRGARQPHVGAAAAAAGHAARHCGLRQHRQGLALRRGGLGAGGAADGAHGLGAGRGVGAQPRAARQHHRDRGAGRPGAARAAGPRRGLVGCWGPLGCSCWPRARCGPPRQPHKGDAHQMQRVTEYQRRGMRPLPTTSVAAPGPLTQAPPSRPKRAPLPAPAWSWRGRSARTAAAGTARWCTTSRRRSGDCRGR